MTKYKLLFLLLFALSTSTISCGQENQNLKHIKPNNDPITIIEPKIATYEAGTTEYHCDDFIWKVNWKQFRKNHNVTGKIRVSSGNTQIIVQMAQQIIFDKLSSFERATVTCNRPLGGIATKPISKLLITGSSKNGLNKLMFTVATTSELTPEIKENVVE